MESKHLPIGRESSSSENCQHSHENLSELLSGFMLLIGNFKAEPLNPRTRRRVTSTPVEEWKMPITNYHIALARQGLGPMARRSRTSDSKPADDGKTGGGTQRVRLHLWKHREGLYFGPRPV